MMRGQAPVERRCRGCGAEDGPLCPTCAGKTGEKEGVHLPGRVGLVGRRLALRGLEWTYRAGVAAGTAGLLACGGFVPVVKGWMDDRVSNWGTSSSRLGGIRLDARPADPDADWGPILSRTDASTLFVEVEEVARRLGARPPQQVRLTYLPCCGVVAWAGGRSRALLLGMPLLDVLTLAELRAILAHELAHLARGDATASADSARFVHCLGLAIDRPGARPRGPLGAWARSCRRTAEALLEPISRGQEARADRLAASIAGGDAAASALVKVALIQPLFKEVLEHYDPSDPEAPNLYAFFRLFWARLPGSVRVAIRRQLLVDGGRAVCSAATTPCSTAWRPSSRIRPPASSAADAPAGRRHPGRPRRAGADAPQPPLRRRRG